MFIKEVKRVPFICTVPGGGVYAIKCYRDAKTFIIKGKKVGYSLKEQVMLAPFDLTAADIESAREVLAKL